MTATTSTNVKIAVKDYRSNSLWRLTLRRIFQQHSAIVGMILLGMIILVAIFAPVMTKYEPDQILIGKEKVKSREAPCVHLFGCATDKPRAHYGD